MKKTLSILFSGLIIASFSIQSANAKVAHVRNQLNIQNQAIRTQIKDVAQTQAQAAAAAKINYDEEYVKKFYAENNLQNNYYKK